MSTFNASIKTSYPRQSYLELYGNPDTDPELAISKKKIEATGREVIIKARPSWDTGVGLCGKHLCHCKHRCMKQLFGVNANTGQEIL